MFVQEVEAWLCMALRSLVGSEGLREQGAGLAMGWGRGPQLLRGAGCRLLEQMGTLRLRRMICLRQRLSTNCFFQLSIPSLLDQS